MAVWGIVASAISDATHRPFSLRSSTPVGGGYVTQAKQMAQSLLFELGWSLKPQFSPQITQINQIFRGLSASNAPSKGFNRRKSVNLRTSRFTG